MTWLRLDDGFADHPKVKRLSDRALRLHLAGMLRCAYWLSDGRIDGDEVRRLLPRVTPATVAELVDAGVWEVVEGGYAVHDWLDYNPPREQFLAERKRNAERQRKWKAGRAATDAVTNAVSNGVANGAPSRPVPLGTGKGLSSPPRVPARPPAKAASLCPRCADTNGWLETDHGAELCPHTEVSP